MSETSNNSQNAYAYKDEAKDFFRNINIQFLVHEMKSPLNILDTNIMMLLSNKKEYGKLSSQQQRFLERSKRSALKLRNLIQTILEVGSSQNGRVDLNSFRISPCILDILVAALETVEHESCSEKEIAAATMKYLNRNNVFFEISDDISDLSIYQDQRKFMYIISNIVRNALYHRDSSIHVSVEKADEQHICIHISDDGPGIAPEDKSKLFMCYASKSHQVVRLKGHGLGLPSSRILARFLGGDISVDPDYDGGTHFIVRLPITFDTELASEAGYEINDVQSQPN